MERLKGNYVKNRKHAFPSPIWFGFHLRFTAYEGEHVGILCSMSEGKTAFHVMVCYGE
jgi:hypothetical protein